MDFKKLHSFAICGIIRDDMGIVGMVTSKHVKFS
jgi:hypothetical protein